jgi:hypothetical protein
MKMLKATVLAGRYQGQIVRVTNVSLDELGQKKAACILTDGSRANILAADLEIIPEVEEPQVRKAKTASMPFLSGSTSSRSLTHTKNMARPRVSGSNKEISSPKKILVVNCQSCGIEFNQEERKGLPGKLTQCEQCAEETEVLMEGTMVFSHKTGATIEIKQNGELKHEAPIFDPKNKT